MMANRPQDAAGWVPSQENNLPSCGLCTSRSQSMDRLTWIHYQIQLIHDLITEAQERGDKLALRRWMLAMIDVLQDKLREDMAAVNEY